jgi:4-hydroxy-tetrahydrodipicolinate synthase
MGYGTDLTRPPRLPLVGEERERILSIVRQCAATRPGDENEP